MRTYLTWCGLLLKAQLKKVSFWCLLGSMIALVGLIHVCTLPHEANTRILVSYDDLSGKDRTFAKAVTERLLAMDSIYQFEVIEDEEDMKDEVLSGKALCGVAFAEDIYEDSIHNKPKNVMRLYCASFANTKDIAKETIYSAFFAEYSKVILEGHVGDIYEEPSEELKQKLLDKAKEYLDGDTLFYVIKEGYEPSGNPSGLLSSQVYPVRGVIALLIFLAIFLACGQKKDYFQRYLPPSKRVVYLFLKALSVALPMMCAGLILLAICHDMNHVGQELLGMLVLFVTSMVIGIIFSWIYRREERYATLVFALLMLNLAICPIFIDVAEVVVAIKFIRFIFPVGIYLGMF